MRSNKLGLAIGHCSDAGQQRDLNEDSYLLLTNPMSEEKIDAMFVVADGMGGHQAGDVASQTLVEAVSTTFSSSDYHQHVAYSRQHPDYYIVVLKEILERINEQIYNLSSSRPDLNGMGTTATIALLKGKRLFWGHVGDSRAYLLHDGHLQQLTQDHTWVAEQVASGQMSSEEAIQHPRRHVLTQSLGNNLVIRVGRGAQDVAPGDTLLLCSDGLTSMVSKAEIQKALCSHADPQTICEQLVALANQRGGPDNITALVAQLTRNNEKTSPPLQITGPIPSKKPTSTQTDTLKLKAQRSQRIDQMKKTFRHLSTILLPLGGALLSGLVGLVLDKILFSTDIPVPVPVIATIATFILGFLISWLTRVLTQKAKPT